MRKLPEESRFTPEDLLREIPNLKLVIDLTFADGDRYYDNNILRQHGVAVKKIKCAGGPNQVPAKSLLQRFIAVVDNFLQYSMNRDDLIGVHCTHGLNRTGYFVCKYMTDRMSVQPQRAIEAFERARGYPIERPRLVRDILKSAQTSNPSRHQMYAQPPVSNCYKYKTPRHRRFRQ